MRRTRLRPVPDGRLQPVESLVFATALALAGLTLLGAAVNLLSAAVALTTLLTYALIYTPLKRRSSFCDGHRGHSGSVTAGDRLGRRARRTVAGRVGAVCDRFPMAAAAFPRDCLDLSR